MSTFWGLAEHWWVIAGLVACSVVCRSFFFLSRSPWVLPGWLERGLKYAPLAALAAVVAPDIVLTQGAGEQIAGSWDARWAAAALAGAWAWWRQDMLETICIGMVVLWTLRAGWGA